MGLKPFLSLELLKVFLLCPLTINMVFWDPKLSNLYLLNQIDYGVKLVDSKQPWALHEPVHNHFSWGKKAFTRGKLLFFLLEFTMENWSITHKHILWRTHTWCRTEKKFGRRPLATPPPPAQSSANTYSSLHLYPPPSSAATDASHCRCLPHRLLAHTHLLIPHQPPYCYDIAGLGSDFNSWQKFSMTTIIPTAFNPIHLKNKQTNFFPFLIPWLGISTFNSIANHKKGLDSCKTSTYLTYKSNSNSWIFGDFQNSGSGFQLVIRVLRGRPRRLIQIRVRFRKRERGEGKWEGMKWQDFVVVVQSSSWQQEFSIWLWSSGEGQQKTLVMEIHRNVRCTKKHSNT